MTTNSDGLESQYRRLVRLFPPTYRTAKGEEIVTALMDGARPGQERPGLGEQWDILRAVVRRWARAGLLPPPQARADALAVLAVVMPFVLLYPAAKAVSLTVTRVAFTGALPALDVAPTWPAWVVWILGLVALLLGRRRVALVLLVASAALMALTLGALLAHGSTLDVLREFGWLVGQAVALLAVAATGASPRGRWRMSALLVTVVAVAASMYSAWMPHNRPLMWTLGGFALVAAGAALLLTRHRYAAPPIATVVAALYVGRFGLGAAERRIPLEGLQLDVGTIAMLVPVPLLTYIAAAVVLSLGRHLGRASRSSP
ncbi:hypothetical protein [Georgenia daeguensis]|uniref:Uncharacterized protein n=1 Tax=Georgenia daeguensis TaxID=908355 RepID=A0ABP8ERG8_9MICO